MAVTNEFIEECLTALGFLGVVQSKKMFGAAAFYSDELLFACADDGVLWWKFDEESRFAFEEAGCTQMTYPTKDGPMPMKYFSSPVGLDSGADQLRPWAELALASAARSGAKKKRKK